MNPTVGNINDAKTKLVELINQHGGKLPGPVKSELTTLIQSFSGSDVPGLITTFTTKLNSYTGKDLPTPVKEKIITTINTVFGSGLTG